MMFVSFTRCVRRLSALVILFYPLMSFFFLISYTLLYQESKSLFSDRALINFRDHASIVLCTMDISSSTYKYKLAYPGNTQ